MIIDVTFNLEMIHLFNKIQKEHSDQCKNKGFNFLNHFLLELVKERLDSYDISNTLNKQILANIMIMLYIRPAKIKNLRISNGDVTGYTKN